MEYCSLVPDTPLAEQSPGAAHTTLKQIIESLLQEAVVLPTFNRAVESQTSSGENKQTYEELLATAILNKVVSKGQRSLASSSPASISSRISPPPQEKENKEYFFGQETLDSKWNPTDLETTSNSSLNEYLQSDSSSNSSSINYVDHVSLTIRQRIEDVTSTNVDDEIQDDVHYFRENTSLLDNSDANWYLKKRELHGSPVPVPMLVPNPTTTAKVLIGDKEIDETSDLSDAISECDDMESVEVQNYRIKTKMIIDSAETITPGKQVHHPEKRRKMSYDMSLKRIL
ncbi:GPI-anchored adhesin-like protein PGA55 [Asbolus verrucosus]|uniref:GPI-anchored adhesin-like protein PGA55 n=1 Tax=Asbolus verrucosus TaxID=1661398 RepID=A0A482V8R7_ASBVE|nr:GPI-anchored adhesin-like protein PGA55 [Asbolus verrucosus]